MKGITVRNLPPRVAKAVRDKARKEGLSLNRTIARLLAQATGFVEAKRKRKQQVLHHDLDRFFGVWSKKEADEFGRALREGRKIEPERWM